MTLKKQANEVTFRDIDINLTQHPVTKQIVTLRDDKAISRSIKNLILTNNYERLFQPEINSHVTGSLFEQMEEISEHVLRERIIDVINNFEERAHLIEVYVVSRPEYNGFAVSIVYRPVNQKLPVTLDFFLERVR